MKHILKILLAASFLSYFATTGYTSQCQSERVKLQMLGTRGPELWDAQASTSYLLWLDDKARVVIDAGPGSVQNFEQSGANYEDLRLFLFTHFHIDHSADLPAYIKGGFFSERTEDLLIFGPNGNEYLPSTQQFINRLFNHETGLYPYLSSFIDQEAPGNYKLRATNIESSYKNLNERVIYSDEQIKITAVSVHHAVLLALAYRIELADCVISFTGDMSGRFRTMPDLAKDSDILVAHNAIAENETGAGQLLHMKPSYIGKLAAQANVKHLLLTHLMKRSVNQKDETLQLIRENYSGVISFPKDLDVIYP